MRVGVDSRLVGTRRWHMPITETGVPMTKLAIIYYSATGHGTTMANRVAATAEMVHELSARGHEVLVQSGAGAGSVHAAQ